MMDFMDIYEDAPFDLQGSADADFFDIETIFAVDENGDFICTGDDFAEYIKKFQHIQPERKSGPKGFDVWI